MSAGTSDHYDHLLQGAENPSSLSSKEKETMSGGNVQTRSLDAQKS
jgi:hypothetical protein